ncbi:MAG: hypothetical protein ACREEL_09855 [Stellaceae bacterium]
MFRGIRETLKPGGLVLIQSFRPEQFRYGTGGPKEIDHLYTAAMLRAAFAGFEILRLAEHDDVIHEGSGHDGMSALIDLAARKTASRPGIKATAPEAQPLRRHRGQEFASKVSP